MLTSRQRGRIVRYAIYAVTLAVVAWAATTTDWAKLQEHFFDPKIFWNLFPDILTRAARNTLIFTFFGFTGGLAIGLVLASEGNRAPVASLTLEKSRILEALDRVRASARPADFTGAVRRASTILAGATHEQRRIFVVTDMQRAGWEAGSGLPESEPPDLALVPVGEGEAWENCAVRAVEATPDPELGPGGIGQRGVGLHAGALLAHQEGDDLELDAVGRPELAALGLGLDLAHLAGEDRDDGRLVVATRGRRLPAALRRLGGCRGRHAPPERECRGYRR